MIFLPTLLKVFIAAYPEAMKIEKPIMTSNYSFATDVCQDSALYFDPLDSKDKIAYRKRQKKSKRVWDRKKQSGEIPRNLREHLNVVCLVMNFEC